MDTLPLILTLLNITGALGLFLYGMVMMSEALQKIAGDRIRGILSAVTANRWKGVSTGFVFTGILQSSSAATVLIISFVNAGIITLTESVGLIMGANIGTTVKLWILALLGFGSSFNISVILLPLVAIAIPFFLSAGSRNRSIAEFILGFALLFFGLQFMKEQVPAMDADSMFLQKVLALNIPSEFISMLLFIGIGMLLTIIFQSSSATITLTIVLAMEGWIPFSLAAAMVLGENIGTTVTALIASLVANNSAKRAALIHLMFNVTGVIWAAILFRPIIAAIMAITGQADAQDMPPELIPYGLAILHSGFNIANTLLLIGFSGVLVKLSYAIIPAKGKKKEKSHLQFIESHISSVSEISIVQAHKEIGLMSRNVQEMFSIIPILLIEKDDLVYRKLLKRVEKLERKVDQMEQDISGYLARVAQGKLSRKGTEELQALLRCIDEIEGIGDACFKMSSIIRHKNKNKLYFLPETRAKLQELFDLTEQSLEIMHQNIVAETYRINLTASREAEDRIDRLRDQLKQEHLADLKEEKYAHATGIVYAEIITQCEKIGDYALNVSEALYAAR